MIIRGGKYCYGQAIGIVLLDRKYPLLPGNVGNASTYNFPVRIKVLYGSWNPPFPPFRDKTGRYYTQMQKYIDILKEFEQEGVKAVTCACGFFAATQQEAAASVSIPVFTSPLLLIPFVHKLLKPGQKVGVLTAHTPYLLEQPEVFLRSVGVDESIPLAIEGMDHSPGNEFVEVVSDRKAEEDTDLMEKEVVDMARKLVSDNAEVGAIVLECSDFPTYSAAIQRAVGLPIFDYIGMINMVFHSVVQRRYEGFM